MKVSIFILTLALLLSVSSCQKAYDQSDFVYVWRGTFKAEENFYRDAFGCAGSLSPCSGYGEVKVTISGNNAGGNEIFFYYKNRLIRKVFSPSTSQTLYNYEYVGENDQPVLTWLYYFHSEWTGGLYLESFPFGDDQNGQKYMNFFERVD